MCPVWIALRSPVAETSQKSRFPALPVNSKGKKYSGSENGPINYLFRKGEIMRAAPV